MKGHIIAARCTREKLPSRRSKSLTELLLKDQENGHTQRVYIDIGYYSDKRIAEVFVTVANVGSYLKTVFESWAILASLAIQFGMPPAKLAQSMSGIKTGTYKIVEGPSRLLFKTVTSIWGAIALVIEHG